MFLQSTKINNNTARDVMFYGIRPFLQSLEMEQLAKQAALARMARFSISIYPIHTVVMILQPFGANKVRLHAVWFIRNTSKFPIRLFLIFSKNLYMTVAYLLLNFLLILAMLFLKKSTVLAVEVLDFITKEFCDTEVCDVN